MFCFSCVMCAATVCAQAVCETPAGLRGKDNLGLQPAKRRAVNGCDTNFRSTLLPSPLVFVIKLWWFTPAAARHTVCLSALIKVSAEPLSLAASQLVKWYVQISLEFSCRDAVIFQVFFSSAPLSCQSPTSIKHGNQPLQWRALPQTHTQTLQRPLLAKCRYFHYQLILKIYSFCFTKHSVLSNGFSFPNYCALYCTVFRLAGLLSCRSVSLFGSFFAFVLPYRRQLEAFTIKTLWKYKRKMSKYLLLCSSVRNTPCFIHSNLLSKPEKDKENKGEDYS